MLDLLFLVPLLPFLAFGVLVLFGGNLGRSTTSFVGVGAVAFSAALTGVIGLDFLINGPPGDAFEQQYWTWFDVGGFAPEVAFRLDPLSLLMTVVVTFVGALILLYSTDYMAGDEGYNRFFAYMNLFVGSMLVLVLARNLLLLYLGWEGVGLCSYLLIGFWYRDPANGRAARKAFIVTRIGDTALIIGLFLFLDRLGTLDIQSLLATAQSEWGESSGIATIAALLLLGGAVGKSAQLPLQTWLPDAMAGPTPVSALIHAATMVTAGVYLIARMHPIFELAPEVMTLVAIIGAVTLVLSGFSALAQTDIKRVLAYSTISQIGYMFLALGVGAWSAAIFHLFTHAFFKALLFLAAGAVIVALDDERDMFRMGGLRRELPTTFWAFLIGASCLAALPLVTAGFYSKDLILYESWASVDGSWWLWLGGMIGVVLTTLYIFRAVFYVFFGDATQQVTRWPSVAMKGPLVILSVCSIFAGLLWIPEEPFGPVTLLPDFLRSALPEVANARGSGTVEVAFGGVSAALMLTSLGVAFFLFYRRLASSVASIAPAWATALWIAWSDGWYFDEFYDRVFVKPLVWVATADRDDFIDLGPAAVARLNRLASSGLTRTQTGQVRLYATGIVAGAVVVVAIALVS